MSQHWAETRHRAWLLSKRKFIQRQIRCLFDDELLIHDTLQAENPSNNHLLIMMKIEKQTSQLTTTSTLIDES